MRASPALFLLLSLSVTLCACETQQPPPASASRFGPPTFTIGNPMETGYRPTSGLGNYSVPMDHQAGTSIPTSSNPLPSGWHGFGGS